MPLSTTLRRALRSTLCTFLVLGAVLGISAKAQAAAGDLYVTSDASNQMRKYNGVSGSYLSVFSTSAGPTGQMAVHFGATNGRVLIGHNAFGVEERDVATGALIKIYNPTGGWQWAGLYAPTGEVYIGDMLTNDVRAYDAATGAFIRVVCAVSMPADMAMGPDGNLYICSWGGGSIEIVDGISGAPVASIVLPIGGLPNDIAFRPGNNAIHVTAMNTNVGYRYDFVTHMINGMFIGTGWFRPHGVTFSPTNGNLLAVDGVTGQVHEFHPVTLAELNPAFLVPAPGDKIVDLEFEPAHPTETRSSTWGRVKALYR